MKARNVVKHHETILRGLRLMRRELFSYNRAARLETIGRRMTALAQALHDQNISNGMPGPRRELVAPKAAEIRLKLGGI